MSRIHKALILAAGKGTRLRPVTDSAPKCLTEVQGRPILWHQLNALDAVGIRHVTLVVGYCGQLVIDTFGSRFRNVELDYRWNLEYASTNSMYSAWIGRDVLEAGAVLLEGDVVVTPGALQRAFTHPDCVDRSVWLVGRFGPECDGSMSTADASGRIQSIRIVRDRLEDYPDNLFKSAGILKLEADYGRALAGWLDSEASRGNTNVYYDLVLADRVGERPLHICNIHDLPWFEIDTMDDLRRAEKLFQPRKHVILVMDGAADLPLAALDGQTPLEAAHIPAIDSIARRGQCGLVSTMYPGVPIDSITGNLGILGYDPPQYYPVGRASFEALAQDIYLDEDDIAFRCNLISLKGDRIHDFTARQIATEQAVTLLNRLRLDADIELSSGQSYRNCLVLRSSGCTARDIVAAAPHQNLGQAFEPLLLRALTDAARPIVARLNALMLDSIEQIREINRDLGTPADMLWLWSPSAYPRLPSFQDRYGLRGAVVAGLDFVRGIGEASGMHTKEIHHATGYLDTSYREKFKFAKNFLLHNDVVFIHVNAPDEEGHAGRAGGKVLAIENIDREIVGPLLQHLEERYADNYRFAVLPDHYTCVIDSQHLDTPVPYCVCGTGVEPDAVERYTERAVAAVHPEPMASTQLLRRLVAEGTW